MPRQKTSAEVFKALAQDLGVKTLADLHAESVRDRPVPPRLIARLFREEKSMLTARQRDIMVLVASGYSNQEVADELGMGIQTVKTHLKDVYMRLGVHNRVEAVNAFVEEAA